MPINKPNNIKKEFNTSEFQVKSLEELPCPNTRRWVVRRKAAVVSAVNNGLLSFKEACERYSLSEEEFQSWQKAIDKNGIAGLRVTRVQHYR